MPPNRTSNGVQSIVDDYCNRSRLNTEYRIIEPRYIGTISENRRVTNRFKQMKPVGKRGDGVKESKGKTTAEGFADAPREYTVDFSASLLDEGNNDRYVVRWNGYTPADDKVEPPSKFLNISLLSIEAK